MPTPWYLHPEALALIGKVRSEPPQCERHFETSGRTRDEWTAYSGEAVEALDKLQNDAFSAHYAASPQKVICAALGEYPVPCFRSDMDEIDLIAANIAAVEMVFGVAA